MRRIIFILGLMALAGCMTVEIPGYVASGHPYQRTMYGSFDQVRQAVIVVLQKRGWQVDREVDPAVYEHDAYAGSGHNMLIFTNVRQYSRILYSTYAHLNVLIHSVDNTAQVEIRYSAMTPLIKHFTSNRNDHYVNSLLGAIQKQLGEK